MLLGPAKSAGGTAAGRGGKVTGRAEALKRGPLEVRFLPRMRRDAVGKVGGTFAGRGGAAPGCWEETCWDCDRKGTKESRKAARRTKRPVGAARSFRSNRGGEASIACWKGRSRLHPGGW